MKSSLIVTSDPVSRDITLLHVDEIRNVSSHGNGSHIMTRMGEMIVDESPIEIMEQHLGVRVPRFITEAEPCDTCQAAEREAEIEAKLRHADAVVGGRPAPRNNLAGIVIAGATLKDLASRLSVRAMCVVANRYESLFNLKLEDDLNNTPLSSIASITEESWALVDQSTPEIAKQIRHHVLELLK